MLIRKLSLITSAIILSAPVLANDITLSYSSNNNTSSDSKTTSIGILSKVINNISDSSGNIYIGVGSSNYSSKHLKSDSISLSWRYGHDERDGAPFSFYTGNDFVKENWNISSNKFSMYSFGVYVYIAKQLDMSIIKIEPSIAYQSLYGSSKYLTLETKKTRYGASFYQDIKPNIELGVFVGREKDTAKMITLKPINGITDFSGETNWYGVIKPYLKYTIKSGAEISLSYEQFKYKSGGQSKQIQLDIGYNF